MKKALFIGAACIDVVIYLDRLPRTEEDIHPDRQVMSLGGCACNAACAAKLVCSDITFAGVVGTGVFGELAEKELLKRELPVIIRSEEENGCCYCFVESGGERTFLSIHGAEYKFKREWLKPLDDISFDYVYVSGLEVEEPTGEALIDYLFEFPERKVFYCPGIRGASLLEKNKRIMSLHPVLHLNRQESVAMAKNLLGKPFEDYKSAAKALSGISHESVVVTLGEDGVYALTKEGEITVPSEKQNVVNTIGAGDTHVGVLIGSLCNGMSFSEALICANKWAARTVASEEAVPYGMSGSVTIHSLLGCDSNGFCH